MSKKIALIIIILILTIIVLFLRKNGPAVSVPSLSQEESSKYQTQRKVDEEKPGTLTEKKKVIEKLVSKLQDTHLKAEERVDYLLKLDFAQNEKEKTEVLVNFIVSQNPYNENVDPHSSDALFFQSEASLRIFAIRKLTENLSLEKLAQAVLEIENQSKDETMKRVAQQALKAKREGRNYFVDTLKAIEEMPLPDK